MKKNNLLTVLLFLVLLLPGCTIVGGIFKAGVWIGAIIVVLVLLMIFGFSKKK